MDYKDYYQILGVEQTASKDEIKNAYRQLALRYHPDRNPHNRLAEDQFKEINEAYEALSDPAKRAHYDTIGGMYLRWKRTHQNSKNDQGFPKKNSFWNNRDTDSKTDSSENNHQFRGLEDLLNNNGFSQFFQTIFSNLTHPNETPSPQNKPDPPPVEVPPQPIKNRQIPHAVRKEAGIPHYPITISLKESYQGSTRIIQSNGRRLEVKIPAGAKPGTKVKVNNAGPIGKDGKAKDVYLVVEIVEDTRYTRKENDLFTEVAVHLYTAILGGDVIVPSPGGNLVLTIPACTQPDRTFRLKGRGMPSLEEPAVRGDLFVQIKIRLPERLSEHQKALFQILAQNV